MSTVLAKTPRNHYLRKPCMKIWSLLIVVLSGWPTAPATAQVVTAMVAAAQSGDEIAVQNLKSGLDSQEKPARGNRKAARALNDEALQLLRQGNSEAAVGVLRRAVVEDGSDAEILGNLGYGLLMTKRASEAKIVLERAAELAPGRSATWGNLGEACADLGDESAAVAAFRIAYLYSRNRETTKAYFWKLINKPEAPAVLVAAATLARDEPELSGRRPPTAVARPPSPSTQPSMPVAGAPLEPAREGAAKHGDQPAIERAATALGPEAARHTEPLPELRCAGDTDSWQSSAEILGIRLGDVCHLPSEHAAWINAKATAWSQSLTKDFDMRKQSNADDAAPETRLWRSGNGEKLGLTVRFVPGKNRLYVVDMVRWFCGASKDNTFDEGSSLREALTTKYGPGTPVREMEYFEKQALVKSIDPGATLGNLSSLLDAFPAVAVMQSYTELDTSKDGPVFSSKSPLRAVKAGLSSEFVANLYYPLQISYQLSDFFARKAEDASSYREEMKLRQLRQTVDKLHESCKTLISTAKASSNPDKSRYWNQDGTAAITGLRWEFPDQTFLRINRVSAKSLQCTGDLPKFEMSYGGFVDSYPERLTNEAKAYVGSARARAERDVARSAPIPQF